VGTLSTHVLDTAAGVPAVGVRVTLEDETGSTWLGEGFTDDDGRIAAIGPERLEAGEYLLRFATGEYFGGAGTATFYPEVVVLFRVSDPGQHYHVPLLLSPFGYATYRGS
jgi:5-hydroxyisourate hydrolase